jgi:hypothetical protein
VSNAVYDVASGLLVVLKSALSSTPGGQPDRACVVPASIAWDHCECGMLAIAATRQYVTDNFPSNIGDVQTIPISCRSGNVVAELIIQIIRCAPSPQGADLAPSCDAQQASALEVLSDAWVVLEEANCYLDSLRTSGSIIDYLVRDQRFQGPLGGCVGSELNVSLELEWD